MTNPLFAVIGTYSAAGLRALAERSATAMEADIAAAAEQLGGRLERMLFIGGTYTLIAIFAFPHGTAPGTITIALMGSRMVEAGAEIVRLLDDAELDGIIASASAQLM